MFSIAIKSPIESAHWDAQMIVWAALVFLIPFQLHYNYVLNCFYHYGAPYSDAGLFANLLWHNNMTFMNGHPRGDFPYFGVHFSPFLLLVSQISHFLPTHMVEFYAGFMATLYASLGLAMFYAFSRFISLDKPWQSALLATMSTAFAFNGSVLLGLWMPHFEYAIPLGVFLTLFHLRCGNHVLAAFFLVFTLSLREDAGLHFASVLAVVVAIQTMYARSMQPIKTYFYYFAAALLYSAVAFWGVSYIRELYQVREPSVFRIIYSGDPFYAHLSLPVIAMRLIKIGHEHLYLCMGFLATMSWSIYRRDPYFAAGFVAIMPWFILNVTAFNGNTGGIYAYYGFPFVIALSWPLLACMWRHGNIIPRKSIREAFLLQLVLSCLSLIAWNEYTKQFEFAPNYWARWGSYRIQPSVEHRDAIREFVTLTQTNSQPLGTVMVDHTFGSLSMGPNTGRNLIYNETTVPVNTAIYVSSGRPTERVIMMRQKNNLPYHYCVTATSVCLFTDRAYWALGPFTHLLTEKR